MHPTRFRVIEQVSRDLFGHYCRDGDPGPPLDLRRLSDLVGLRLERADLSTLGAGVLGALSIAERTIYTDSRVTGNRMRFTIAHEIGHFLLHAKAEVGLMTRKSAGLKAATLLCGHAGQGRTIEREADIFAGAILLPGALLLGAEKDPAYLARTFGASMAAAEIRLEQISRYRLLRE